MLGKTRAEAKAKLKQAIEEAKELGTAKIGRYTMGQWMEVWFEHYAKIKIRPSSHQTCRDYIDNHIKPNISKIPLERLASLELQEFYKKLLEKGRIYRVESRKQSKELSARTVRSIHQIISFAMKLAQKQKLIANNPAKSCALPRLEHREMQTLLVEQLQSLFREARDSDVFELYCLELATGLRRGELLGLKWKDIDLERGDLRVRRQIARISGEVVGAPLKAKNAYRTLPLAESTVGVLEAQERKTGSSSWVFLSSTGVPIFPGGVLYVLHRVLKGAGLPRVKFRDLHHTLATLALQNRVDMKTVSGTLGHFSAWFTLNTYAHVTTASQRRATKTMGGILSASLRPWPLRDPVWVTA